MKEDGRFKEGNEAAKKWTEEDLIDIFNDCYNEVYQTRGLTNSYLSIEDVLIYVKNQYKMSSSTFYAKAKSNPVLEDIKKDIHTLLISTINKGAITGDFNATGCIWRMKQLGERDPDKAERTEALKDFGFKVTQE